MTKQALNTQKNHKLKNKEIKRFKYKFYKRNLKRKIITCKASTTNETHKNKDGIVNKNENTTNFELIKENILRYSDKLLTNYLQIYGKNIMDDLLLKESKENKKIINESILNKYNLTKAHRKYIIKYLFNLIQIHGLNIKSYFSTVSIFDLFLINYSEESDDNCATFFYSKKTNKFSETKLFLFVLCCFYLVSKYRNINRILTVDKLLEYENAKEEVDYDDLIELINDIMVYIDADISDINLYYYIEYYMIDMLKNFTELANYPKFLDTLKKNVVYFGVRILQDLDLLDIQERIQALGIILFSYEYSKFKNEENSEIIDRCLSQWKENIKNVLINYDNNGLAYVINWLNYYISQKKFLNS